MILIAVSAPSTVAMLTAVGFGFLGAVVDEDGTVNHIQSIFSVYPHRDPYPPAMHRAMPCGDTMMPFCEGLYEPRTMGRGLLFILYQYSYCIKFLPPKVRERCFIIVGLDRVAKLFGGYVDGI